MPELIAWNNLPILEILSAHILGLYTSLKIYHAWTDLDSVQSERRYIALETTVSCTIGFHKYKLNIQFYMIESPPGYFVYFTSRSAQSRY